MSESLNGDLSLIAHEDTSAMEWMPSPSGSVFRKRVHRVGPAESGQVTSVVRYEPNSVFPAHDHPEGEEILVLEGIFSDEHGDWEAGTYLLNPEGFRHSPFSEAGCRIFVKLRQFPGLDRRHIAIQTNDMAWSESGEAGVRTKLLYEQSGYCDRTSIEEWAPGTNRGEVKRPEGAEIFVLAGAFADEHGHYAEQSWIRLPPGSEHRPRTDEGVRLYVKTGGFPYQRSA